MLNVGDSRGAPAKRAGISVSYRFLLTLAAVLVLDQATKLAVMRFLPWSPESPVYSMSGAVKPIPVIDGLFYIVHITNQGAAWGILPGQTYLLNSIAVVTLAAMWFFRRELGCSHPQMQYAMGIFCGGVLGNLVDRLCYGHVVDFLDVHIPLIGYRWPAFNVADCAIAVGVGLYLVISLVLEHREKREMKSGRLKRDGGMGK